MSEELEFIEFLISASESEKHFINLANYDNRIMLLKIKEKLQRLESIDNVNPNAALEVLEKTISPLLEPILAKYEDDLSDKITANYFALKQALLKAQENEKFKEDIIKMFKLENSPYKDNEYIIKVLQCQIINVNKFQDKFIEVLEKKNEYEQALEILKSRVDFVFFDRTKEVKIEQDDDSGKYVYLMNGFDDSTLPEEEFDTLKEVLE